MSFGIGKHDPLRVIEVDEALSDAERARLHANAAEELVAVVKQTNAVKHIVYAKANVHATLALFYTGQA
jgi:hypothetical protein